MLLDAANKRRLRHLCFLTGRSESIDNVLCRRRTARKGIQNGYQSRKSSFPSPNPTIDRSNRFCGWGESVCHTRIDRRRDAIGHRRPFGRSRSNRWRAKNLGPVQQCRQRRSQQIDRCAAAGQSSVLSQGASALSGTLGGSGLSSLAGAVGQFSGATQAQAQSAIGAVSQALVGVLR